MEQEIDLRPYFAALLRRWRLIVGVAILALILALGITLLQPRTYTYTAEILFKTETNQLQFDDRFTTSTNPLDSNANRTQTLTELARNITLEQRVVPTLPADLIADDFAVGDLAGLFEVSGNGDFVRISITDTDPQRAEALLNAWVSEYIQLINELYGFDDQQIAQIEAQIAGARQRYDASQQALEAFIGTGEMVQLEQRIAEIDALLNGARTANQQVYNQYLERARQLDAIINDAQTLRQQVQRGGNAQADNLGQLLLRARAAGNFELPLNLRLDVNETTADSVGAAEIEELIQVLEQRRVELLDEAQQFAAALTSGEQGDFALPIDVRRSYEQDLANLQQQYEQVVARHNALRQERDVALEALSILQRKLNEQALATNIIDSQVQLIGIAQAPSSNTLVRLVLSAGIAMVLGALMAAVVVVGLEFVAQRRRAAPDGENASEQPRDRPVAGQP